MTGKRVKLLAKKLLTPFVAAYFHNKQAHTQIHTCAQKSVRTAMVRAEKRQHSILDPLASPGRCAALVEDDVVDEVVVVVMRTSHTGARRRARYRHRPWCAEDQLGSGLGFTALHAFMCVCVRPCLEVFKSVCMLLYMFVCVRVYTCMCVCTQVCLCVYERVRYHYRIRGRDGVI